MGWVTHQGIAQGWFRRSAKGSRKQSPWEGKKLGCSLQKPGHPSSASSRSWGLEGGKGNSWAPCYRSVLFPAKRHGASSSKEINTPTGRPTKTSHLEYSITNAGPGHWEVENPLYERSLDLKGRGWTPSYTHQLNCASNPMFVYQETTSTSVLFLWSISLFVWVRFLFETFHECICTTIKFVILKIHSEAKHRTKQNSEHENIL